MLINAEVIYNNRLSWKAKGLYCGILSLDIQDRSHKSIRTISKDGSDSIRSGLDELIKFGYLEIIKLNNKGKFQYEWRLKEEM